MQSLVRHFKSLRLKSYNPILITDIDGVLVRGSRPIQTTLQALHKIHQNKIPFACLTNGGGQLQKTKSQKLNKIFNLNLPHEKYFHSQNMFMNHSPLKPQIINHSKKGQWILVTGSLQIEQILHDLGVKNYITCDQLYTLYHQEFHQVHYITYKEQEHFSSFYKRKLTTKQVKKSLQQRCGNNKNVPEAYEHWAKQIGAIFAMNDVSPYETALETIHNILSLKKKNSLPFPAYFASQNDIIWASLYKRPRMAFGPFNYILKNHCLKYDFSLQQIHFGKPELKAFKFVQSYMNNKFCTKHTGQACFFMVGDNPRADIKGANRAGWASFLTQTGIHHGSQNDKENPATVVVNDFRDAVNLIINLKNQLLNQGLITKNQ